MLRRGNLQMWCLGHEERERECVCVVCVCVRESVCMWTRKYARKSQSTDVALIFCCTHTHARRTTEAIINNDCNKLKEKRGDQ